MLTHLITIAMRQRASVLLAALVLIGCAAATDYDRFAKPETSEPTVPLDAGGDDEAGDDDED
mgnify:CR=1 FL=1